MAKSMCIIHMFIVNTHTHRHQELMDHWAASDGHEERKPHCSKLITPQPFSSLLHVSSVGGTKLIASSIW